MRLPLIVFVRSPSHSPPTTYKRTPTPTPTPTHPPTHTQAAEAKLDETSRAILASQERAHWVVVRRPLSRLWPNRTGPSTPSHAHAHTHAHRDTETHTRARARTHTHTQAAEAKLDETSRAILASQERAHWEVVRRPLSRHMTKLDRTIDSLTRRCVDMVALESPQWAASLANLLVRIMQ